MSGEDSDLVLPDLDELNRLGRGPGAHGRLVLAEVVRSDLVFGEGRLIFGCYYIACLLAHVECRLDFNELLLLLALLLLGVAALRVLLA